MSERDDGLEVLGFAERLAGAEAVARASGVLDGREYEALLVDPGFEAEGFAAFRERLGAAGVALPDAADDVESVPARVDRAQLRGEAERDLLDLYLDALLAAKVTPSRTDNVVPMVAAAE